MVQQDRSSNSIPEIQITFPNGHQDNLILHKHYSSEFQKNSSKEYCHYLGHLEKDVQACVAVTGCIGEPMDLTIMSEHNTIAHMYHLDTEGRVEAFPMSNLTSHGQVHVDDRLQVELGSDEGVENPSEIPEMLGYVQKCSHWTSDTSGCKPVPETNQLDLMVGYDDGFRYSFNSVAQANEYVYKLLTHAQAEYCVPSLGTKIQLKLNRYDDLFISLEQTNKSFGFV